MKKLSKFFILLIVCILMMSGCQKKEEETTEEKQAEELEIEEKEEQTKEDGSTVQGQEEAGNTEQAENQEPVQEAKTVTIYSPNENADGFVTSQTETASVTGDWVMNQLIAKGVVPGNVQVVSCEETLNNGVNSLNLDLNQAFGTFLQSMGTTGEYVALGSVCNTFLDAYGCDQVQITVEGNTLATGHAEYPGYLTKFE